MSDGGNKVLQALGTMNTQERRAYSTGLSQAYADVFDIFTEVFRADGDIHDAHRRISELWDYVRATQVIKGVL